MLSQNLLPETTFPARRERNCMLFGMETNTLVLVGLVVVFLSFILAVYLFMRRTLLAFREGMDSGRR